MMVGVTTPPAIMVEVEITTDPSKRCMDSRLRAAFLFWIACLSYYSIAQEHPSETKLTLGAAACCMSKSA